MPYANVIISENVLSRPFALGEQAGYELIFDVMGTDDDLEVRYALDPDLGGEAPDVFRDRILDSIDIERVGHELWKAHCRYVRLEEDDEYTFDTTGGTQKVTQSLATIAAYAPPGFTPPDFQGAIGVSADRVEGVDLIIPAYGFTVTKRFPDSIVTPAYRRDIFLLTGRTNDDVFFDCAEGEALFLGATGSKRGRGDWSITFRFAGSPNVAGLSIGDITGITKPGWAYLWVRYADFEDSFAFALVKRPIAAYVEQVYHPGDYTVLLIGS